MIRRPVYLTALLLAGAFAVASPADAQSRRGPWDQGPYGSSRQPAAWDNGYRQGLSIGERDARAGRQFDVRGTREYRSADWGYDRRHGSRAHYRDVFRQGFESGYRAGYDRHRSGRAIPRGPNRYPDSRYPGSSRGGYLYSVAGDRGFSDGYQKGLDDGRSGRRFDPARHKWYRSGDRGFNRRYGTKHEYQAVYRDAFRAGYERGYRERGGSYGERRPGWWPF